MTKFIKSLRKIIDVSIASPNETDISKTTQYQKLINSKSYSNVIEKSQGDFEKNSLGTNAKYFINNDNNPLVYGLKNLDRFALVIGNKSLDGVMMFADKPIISTPNIFKNSTIEEATDIVLYNLGVYEPVKLGLRQALSKATAFNSMSIEIAKAVRVGALVYTSYSANVFSLGKEVMTEWSNNGI